MRVLISGFLILVSLTFALPSSAQETPEQAAIAAAEQFLGLINDNSIDLAYLSTASYLQEANSQQLWVRSVGTQRTFYGEKLQHSVRAITVKNTLSHHPDGSYISIIFESQFEKKAYSIERLEMILEVDGTWRVAEYFWN